MNLKHQTTPLHDVIICLTDPPYAFLHQYDNRYFLAGPIWLQEYDWGDSWDFLDLPMHIAHPWDPTIWPQILACPEAALLQYILL